MRLALACLMTLPAAAFADTFTVPSTPTAVTVYAYAAQVTRALSLEVPAGQHDVILPGLPRAMDPQSLRVTLRGAALGTTQYRSDAVAPQPAQDSAAIDAAKARITAAEEALQNLDDQVAEAEFAISAAQAKSDFLSDLGENSGLPSDVATLRDLARMIGGETLTARQETLTAQKAARALNTARPDLERALQDARAALAALTPPPDDTAQLSLSLTAPEAGTVAIDVSYLVSATWEPAYDIHLTDSQVSLRRGAKVAQYSDENWTDVALTLSTFNLSSQTAPQEVYPIPLVLYDKEDPQQKLATRPVNASVGAVASFDAPVVMAEEAAVASFDGPGVRYTVAAPVSIASNVDALRVPLDTLEFDARRFARAAPRFDSTAFLMAEFINSTQEPLLAASEAALYLDNTLIGRSTFDPVPAGAETTLPFGAIEELRLTYTTLNEAEGDRGIINRSNARSETARLDIQNIGAEPWEVEVQSAVPYAVQEDLEITWRADPMPSSQDIDDQRGVLQWDIDVPAGTTSSITIRTDLSWPEDKVLR